MKKAAALITVLIFFVSMLSIGTAEQNIRPGSYALGTKINDFTFTTYNGEEVTLSEVLKEKDMVLINVWASWCGPCKMEFPYLQEAYDAYRDQVEVFALSCEASDTDKRLADFADAYGLTFKIGRDPVNFLRGLNMNSIPVSLVVDRYGVICFIQAGAQTSAGAFTRLFDVFVGRDYPESILLNDIPPVRPSIDAVPDEEISEALNADGRNVSAKTVWPMAKVEKDGRIVMKSTNGGYQSSTSAVEATVHAENGEAIVVTFKTSTESVFDPLQIIVNDQKVKCFAGEHDWMTYAIPVDEAGEYTVTAAYTKDHMTDSGEDTVWIDSISVVQDAAAALAGNPIYPTHDSVSLDVVTPSARQIMIEDPHGILVDAFGPAKYYVANSSFVEVVATLTAEIDPEQAFLVNNANTYISLADIASDDGYCYTADVDDTNSTGYLFSYAMLYETPNDSAPLMLINFYDENDLNQFIKQNHLGSWQYVETEMNSAVSPALSVEATYTIKCTDTEGNPIPGVMLQICDESTCQVAVTDSDGKYTMTTSPYPWEVHILMAPSGYKNEADQVKTLPIEGGEAQFILTKE